MKLTRAELIGILAQQVGLTQQASKEVLAVFFDAITNSLGSGKDVKLRHFGRFQTVEIKELRAPVSRENGDHPLSFRKVVRFRCSKFLKAFVNDGGLECSVWPVELEQLYENLVSSDRFQAIFKNHRQWLATRGKQGRRADLTRCHLQGAYLEEVDLREIKLSCANLVNACLSDANLEDADLENANLEAACLASASLKRANLRGASLRGANLKEADLQDADLSGADLHYADLGGAELKNAKFTNCQFFKTNLKHTLLDRKLSNSMDSLETLLRNALKTKRIVPCGEPE
jgi:uncharacterized protein YjbI with pentapeptide repeats